MVLLSELLEGSSSSSATHVHSSSIHGYKYDVFLSFRGLDTRHSFTDHLYKALTTANITTFLDDEDMETGEDIKPELESAIKASRASIIILSKNYAFSTWCLDELALILEQRMTSDHIVIPIFYHVEPTHVRKQQSSFGDAMMKHKQTMDGEANADKRSQWAQKMDRWNKALVEVVANLDGKDVSGRLETKFIEEIVKDIYRKLHVPLTSVQTQLVGMESHIEFITSWLKDGSSHTADILTILGMGGTGKTSLAKHVYRLHCHEFQASSFIEDASRRCDGKFHGLLDLQEQFCGDILKTSSVENHDVLTYTSKIENAVNRKRVFVVLDDIDNLDQLDALLGSKGLHPGSKIIITTKDACLTERCALFKTTMKPKHSELFLRGLHQTESRQLLCLHAFMCFHPKLGYEEVTEKLVNYCQGHPLAIEVLGKSLYNREVAYWEGCIKGLKKEIGSRVNNVLRMSFDALPSNNDKELFKHIACFFVGIDRYVTETILEACDINPRSGITTLIERCLLSVGGKNELKMHGLVQEMGRFEVRQESLDKPWKRSRLWCHEESFKVLKRKKGKGNLLGLALDMRMLEKETLGASSELKTDALNNLDNLMLLQLNYVNMIGSYEKFPQELRALCMHGFHQKSIPSDLHMENLVALDMSYSNIESFLNCDNNTRLDKRQKLDGSCVKYKTLLSSLKVLNLSFCIQLRSVGDFDQLPALEMLILRGCIGLLEICESIEQCVELVYIDLSYCNKLKELPRNIYKLKKVKTIFLDGCNLGDSRIEIRDMDSPELCKADNIVVNRRTSFSAFLGAIQSDLKSFSISLPSSLVTLSLINNNLSTASFPMDLSCLSMLKELYLDRNPLHSMPNCVRTLPRLDKLSMENCKYLKSVEHPPLTLTQLLISSDKAPYVEKLVLDPEIMPSLRIIYNWMRNGLFWYEIEGMVKVQPVVDIEEKVLRSLGWTNLDLLSKRHVGNGSQEFTIHMVYEFGIFSTVYQQEEMSSWFSHTSTGPSISVTIPSSPNKIRGLNFCSVHTYKSSSERFQFPDEFPIMPMITITNTTKNQTWIYEGYWDLAYKLSAYTLLSHWMFGMNEVEGGDHVTISVIAQCDKVIDECGVSLVYDDGAKDEVEDALGYYKSWNHIIGGDLSPFQTTTGEYILWKRRFRNPDNKLFPFHHKIVGDGSSYRVQKEGWFKALS